MILYIHGFNSAGTSETAEKIKMVNLTGFLYHL